MEMACITFWKAKESVIGVVSWKNFQSSPRYVGVGSDFGLSSMAVDQTIDRERGCKEKILEDTKVSANDATNAVARWNEHEASQVK